MLRPRILAIILCLFRFTFVESSDLRFIPSDLQGDLRLKNPTSLQFGPDGRLYVSQKNGSIRIYTIEKKAAQRYVVTRTEGIDLIRMIPNHDDTGNLSPAKDRLVTGILVTGTPKNPILYITSSDIRISRNRGFDICTNSGIISKLSWTGSKWVKLDLVRGLPRSISNHATNGMQLDSRKNILYVANGGFTNAGSPSNQFGFYSEYALSAAILSVDLNMLAKMSIKGKAAANPYVYDLPTLDDPSRRNQSDGSDVNDPFGGHSGLNQAKIVAGGPVQVFAAGFRNVYDLVITNTPGRELRMYAIDNGANIGWGGLPDQEGRSGKVTNRRVPPEEGLAQIKNLDALHFIGHIHTYVPGSYYGGHPNPVRANPLGAGLYIPSDLNGLGFWRSSKKDSAHPLSADWPPVPLAMARAMEGDYQMKGKEDRSLLTFTGSTNGIAEYTSSMGNKAMQGDLLAVSFASGKMHRIRLNQTGNAVLNKSGLFRINAEPPLALGFAGKPLDVTVQGDEGRFPGTIWVAAYGGRIVVLDPETGGCSARNDSSDEDRDRYSNRDEKDNGSDPCSAASKPQDHDGDYISDLNDPDDDNDKIPDRSDPFALDSQNGRSVRLPVRFEFANDSRGGLFDLGFTGLMSNGKTDYLKLFQPDNIVAGAAAGLFTIEKVSSGDALGSKNNQENAFQFGIHLKSAAAPFYVKTRMAGPFFRKDLLNKNVSQGFYIGNGDQDNYIKMILTQDRSKPVIVVVIEVNGKPIAKSFPMPRLPGTSLDLLLSFQPAQAKVEPKYSIDGGSVVTLERLAIPPDLMKIVRGETSAAIGLIATSIDPRVTFSASWNFIEVKTLK